MIGHTLGISQKYNDAAKILNIQNDTFAFITNLDGFSCISGSPVFDHTSQKIIGIFVRGTGTNYTEDIKTDVIIGQSLT